MNQTTHKPQLEKRRILVIDDEVDVLEYYVDLLDGYDVKPFQTPDAFLKYFEDPKNPRPHLVISDYKMPGMTGLDMIKQARKNGADFPWILLSGFLDKQNTLSAVDFGVYRVLEKPCQIEVLLAVIDQIFIEYDVFSVRREILEITSRLRELYSGIRMIMDQHIPKNILDRMVVETDASGKNRSMGFGELLEYFESKLDQLIKSEKILTEMRLNKTRDYGARE